MLLSKPNKTIQPALRRVFTADFRRSLSPRFTFERNQTKMYVNIEGASVTAAIDEPTIVSHSGSLLGIHVGANTTDNDLCYLDDLKWHKRTQGTFIIEFTVTNATTGTYTLFDMRRSGSPSNAERFYANYNAATGLFLFRMVSGGSEVNVQANMSSSSLKVAMTYDSDSMAISVDGGTVATNNSVTIPADDMATLLIGAAGNTGSQADFWGTALQSAGTIKSFSYSPMKATNSMLQSLSS